LVAALLGAGLMVYAQTSAFTGDEGFHLLAAQLIDKGKRPYIDFAFPQTPLNAYFNAWCMRLFGQTWRVPHAAAALLTIGAALLAAQFVWRRFPASEKWRTAGALIVCIAILTNAMTVEYGAVAQAYAICMFLTVAAFRVALLAVERRSPLTALGAGLFAGAAAACSLLTASAAAVYLLWVLFGNRAGNRWIKAAAYCAGGAIPFAPVAWLWMQASRPVIFNLIEYHLFFRKLYWPETTQHDLEIVTSWIDSGQALLLLLFSVAGFAFVMFRSHWKSDVRREFYLCAWVALAMCAEISTAHPTFARYYILVVPFAAILAAVGVYVVSERVYRPESPYLALTVLTALLGLGLAKSLYQRASDIRTWRDDEQMAKKVDEVLPRNAPLFADEEVYFLTDRTPPEGLEFSYSHKLKLAPALAKQLHIVDQDRLNRMLSEGKFAGAATCDDEFIDAMHFDTIYAHKFETDDCYVYWGKTTR
jgi:uncharacterized membrane protein SirB2